MIRSVSFVLVTSFLFAANSFAAEVKVNWKNPDQYRDVEAANETQKSFQDRVFKRLDKHFATLAKSLPEGDSLWITVTDLDLAGRVLPDTSLGLHSGNEMRIVKKIDYPAIQFSYTLTDVKGNVRKKDSVSIKDLGFQERIGFRAKRGDLRYELIMLEDWFKDTFES